MTRPRGYETPWGLATDAVRLSAGVEQVETESHGGLRLDPEAQAQLPQGFKSFTGSLEWMEEDVDAPMVLWFLCLGHEANLFQYGENVAKHGSARAARNWRLLKAERAARRHQAAAIAAARIRARAARSRALAEAAA